MVPNGGHGAYCTVPPPARGASGSTLLDSSGRIILESKLSDIRAGMILTHINGQDVRDKTFLQIEALVEKIPTTNYQYELDQY